MPSTVTIAPYGSLTRTLAVPSGRGLDQPLADEHSLAELLDRLGVARDQVQLAMVNHRAAALDTRVRAGDRIALFPREYPIFVDWYAYRSP